MIVNPDFRVLIFDLNGTITGRVSEHQAHIQFRNEYITQKLGCEIRRDSPKSTTLALQVCGLNPIEYYKYRNSVIDWNLFHYFDSTICIRFNELKALGYKLVLYTDCYGEQIKKTLEILRLDNVFDLIISEEYNLKKPNPKVFLFVSEQFNCELDQILMLGNDYSKDLLPLLILGGNAILTNNYSEIFDYFDYILETNKISL